MKETVKALIVAPDASYAVREVRPELDVLQGIVDGWLEGINGPDWHAYVDEEGKLKHKPINRLATFLALAGGWFGAGDLLCGTVIFLGNGPEGDEADVPERVLLAWTELVGTQLG